MRTFTMPTPPVARHRMKSSMPPRQEAGPQAGLRCAIAHFFSHDVNAVQFFGRRCFAERPAALQIELRRTVGGTMLRALENALRAAFQIAERDRDHSLRKVLEHFSIEASTCARRSAHNFDRAELFPLTLTQSTSRQMKSRCTSW